jgi:hypothetical protein
VSGDPSTSRSGPNPRPVVKDPQGRDPDSRSTAAKPAAPSGGTGGSGAGGARSSGAPTETVRRSSPTGPLPRVTPPRAPAAEAKDSASTEVIAASTPATPAPPVRPGAAPMRPAEPEVAPTDLSAAVVTAVPQAGAGAVRRARLTVTSVDPWSVMKMSFLLSLAGGIVLVIAIWLLWLLLVNGGVFVSIDRTVGDIAGSGSTISVVEVLSLRRVMGIALMLAVVQVVLVTALATLAAFLYNLASGLVGGFEVTLAEDR